MNHNIRDDIWAMLKRDFGNVGRRFTNIFTQNEPLDDIEDYDFYGPLLIAFLFPAIIYFPGPHYNFKEQVEAFVLFFAFIWVGVFVCAMTATIVGTYASVLSIASTLIYLLLPLLLSVIFTRFMPLIIKLCVCLLTNVYCLTLSGRALKTNIAENKLALVMVPVFFIYTICALVSSFN